MKILLFGDVVGKPGRQALARALPTLRATHQPALVVANVENMAHGFGITPDTIDELRAAGVDVFTSGNHIWKNAKGVELLRTQPLDIVRPLNYPADLPGRGYTVIERSGVKFLIVNLIGQVFMKDVVTSPFVAFDQVYAEHGSDAITLVDFHAEATGEKRAMGWHVAGRATAVVGTHTHVPTADEQILPGATAYISDLGMCGATDSSLGMKKDLVLEKVVHGADISLEPPENPAEVVAAGVLIEFDPVTKQARSIERIDQRTAL